MQHRFLLVAAIALAGCRSPETVATAPDGSAALSVNSHQHGPAVPPQGPLPFEELRRARSATARYRNIENAFADGYLDIHVTLPNMGQHFLRGPVDETFEVERPELLVYSPDANGRLELVALEYAVPLSDTPPEGFTGSADQWVPLGEPFNLWALHAWVWKENPDGVFNPTNSRVP